MGAFIYTNCTANCSFTEENGPPDIKVLKNGHESAERILEYLVHLVCGTSLDCSYVGEGLVGTARGPLLVTQKDEAGKLIYPNGEVTLTEQLTTKETGGFLCPKNSFLTITTTPLTATYITE